MVTLILELSNLKIIRVKSHAKISSFFGNAIVIAHRRGNLKTETLPSLAHSSRVPCAMVLIRRTVKINHFSYSIERRFYSIMDKITIFQNNIRVKSHTKFFFGNSIVIPLKRVNLKIETSPSLDLSSTVSSVDSIV